MQPNIAIDKQATDPLDAAYYVKSVAEAAINVASDCETTNHLTQSLFTGRDGVYWRFNVGVRVGNDWAPMISLDEYEGMPKLVALTKTYLAGSGEGKRVEQCASALKGTA